MSRKPDLEPDNKEQSERFIETVKELEIDESGEAFNRVIKGIIPSKPQEDHSHPSEKKSSA